MKEGLIIKLGKQRNLPKSTKMLARYSRNLKQGRYCKVIWRDYGVILNRRILVDVSYYYGNLVIFLYIRE